MEQLIRFRKLADSLSQNEFYSFIKTSNLDIRSIILKGLFSSFHTQIQNYSNSADLTETIQIISKIIRSRNSKQLKEIESKKEATKFSLNDLPFALIGECASYLPFMDYHALQNVSRSVFIGCNDPNTMTTIDYGIFDKNYKSKQHLKLRKYQKVVDFEINVPNFLKMKSIHNLSLSSNAKSLSLYDSNTTSIKTFLNMKCLNFDKIEIVELNGYGCDDIDDHVNTFCALLKCFKNIKFLQVGCAFDHEDRGFLKIFETEQFRNKIFNNLQGLSLEDFGGEEFHNHLLHYFSDKLLSLHFVANITSPKNGFINLKEVCIAANYWIINDLIKTAKKLERIHFTFDSDAYDYMKDDFDNYDDELEDTLMELFNQNTLEFISIEIEEDIQPIKNVLQNISFSKRKRLKIRLEIADRIENANEYFEILENKFSEDGVIDNWMIIFIFRFIEPMRKYFTQNEHEQHGIGDIVQLMKTNKECKINGRKERWLHHCDFCCNK